MKLSACAVIAIAAGCAFVDRPGQFAGDDDPGPGAPGAEGKGTCDASDPTLRLCVDFEAPFVDSLLDLSGTAASALVAAVGTMDHDAGRAAVLGAASTIQFAESSQLDLQRALAVDLWIRPTALPIGAARAWIVDNERQYSVSIDGAGRVRCTVKEDKHVDSPPLADDHLWHHVGCTYDGKQQKVFVDGALVACRNEKTPVPIDGMAGLALGANLEGTPAAPIYTDRYLGGLDNVRVWARSAVDMCIATGATECAIDCPL